VPENRGPWDVAVRERSAEVRPAGGQGADVALATDSPTFAQIFAGEMAPSTAVRLGRARVEGGVAALDRAFELYQSFWLPDAF
ncbi:MAG: sterol carrier protein domain-containing protein, partial [Gemmatimonadota bacterium]